MQVVAGGGNGEGKSRHSRGTDEAPNEAQYYFGGRRSREACLRDLLLPTSQLLCSHETVAIMPARNTLTYDIISFVSQSRTVLFAFFIVPRPI